jgi:uncharacterized SAM-binding protein YcdF (DUF218 family)
MVLKINTHQSTRKISDKPRHLKRKIFAVGIATTTVFLWVGYKQVESYFLEPEAIVVLGGHEDRERFAAKLGQQHPDLPIWISSGSPQAYANKIFARAGIKNERLHYDYRARDTVTNFTTLVDELVSRDIDSVYLVTSENHMFRARAIGEIVFGSRGIAIKPMSVPSKAARESFGKSFRDISRAIMWLATGYSGEVDLPELSTDKEKK